MYIKKALRFLCSKFNIRLFRLWRINSINIDCTHLNPAITKLIILERYEAAEVKACKQLIKRDDKVLELGGAIGYIGLFCIKNCKASKVTSVEANPTSIKILKRNYDLNSLEPDIIEGAVSNKPGKIQFSTSDNFLCDRIHNEPISNSSNSIRVTSYTLRDIVKKIHYEPTVIICDIEGAELDLAWDDLPTSVKCIIIELHGPIRGYPETYRLLHKLISMGFSVHFHSGDVYGLTR